MQGTLDGSRKLNWGYELGDKIVRRLIDKATGLPITGKTVKAVKTLDPTLSKQMPETPSGSGFYVSADEAEHGEYKIYVDNVDSNDTQPVEPGRFNPDWPTDKTRSAWIDRSLSNKVYLSSYLDEGAVEVPTHAMLVAAINQALSSKRELVIDRDVATTALISSTSTNDLVIDLNGKQLTLTNGAISTAGRIIVSNGTIALPVGSKGVIGAYGTLMFAVNLTGGVTQQVNANPLDSYVKCKGITARPGTTATMPTVVGAPAVGSADQLKLTDVGSDAGVGRVTSLQSFIDTDMAAVVGNAGFSGWLSASRKAEIAKLSDTMPVTMRNALRDGNVLIEGVKSASILGTDSSGKVVPTTSIRLSSLFVDSLTMNSQTLSSGNVASSLVNAYCIDNSSGSINVTIPNPSQPAEYKEITLVPRSTTYDYSVTAKFGNTTKTLTFSSKYSPDFSVPVAVKLAWIPDIPGWAILSSVGP